MEEVSYVDRSHEEGSSILQPELLTIRNRSLQKSDPNESLWNISKSYVRRVLSEQPRLLSLLLQEGDLLKLSAAGDGVGDLGATEYKAHSPAGSLTKHNLPHTAALAAGHIHVGLVTRTHYTERVRLIMAAAAILLYANLMWIKPTLEETGAAGVPPQHPAAAGVVWVFHNLSFLFSVATILVAAGIMLTVLRPRPILNPGRRLLAALHYTCAVMLVAATATISISKVVAMHLGKGNGFTP